MGMIGGGIGAFIGDAHRRASRICNDFELVGGVFDADYEKSKQFAKNEGIVFDVVIDSRCLIKGELPLPADERMDVGINCHTECPALSICKKPFIAGFHVVCEKPMTMTVQEAEELERIVEEEKTDLRAHSYLHRLSDGKADEGHYRKRHPWDNTAH